jgi:hypothetical protein
MCQGGISRKLTRRRIARAHGRTSSNVRNDIGAMLPGRWQTSHFAWSSGATCLAKVTVSAWGV